MTRRRENTKRTKAGEKASHVEMEQIRVMLVLVKEPLEPPLAGRQKEELSFRCFRGSTVLQTSRFQTSGLQSCQQVSIVLTPQV